MKATKIIHDKLITKRLIIERTVWKLPNISNERPHGLKYSLHCCKHDGFCVVRYDNEAGKGDHVHYGTCEQSYIFTSLTNLLLDFANDIKRLTGDST